MKLAGKQKSVTLTQDKDRMAISFHTEIVGQGLFEFTVCSYSPGLEDRHEYVTLIDSRHIDMLHKMMGQWLDIIKKHSEKKDLT